MHLDGVLTLSPHKSFASAPHGSLRAAALRCVCLTRASIPVSFSRNVVLPVDEVLEVDHETFLGRDVCAYMGIDFDSQPVIFEVTAKNGETFAALRVRILKGENAAKAGTRGRVSLR